MTRIEREKRVIAQMTGIYCRKKHGSAKGMLCDDCRALLEYAHARLERCPHGEKKSSCRKCPVHCYTPKNRQRVRDVMRYVGPRMLLYSPLEAIRHLICEMK